MKKSLFLILAALLVSTVSFSQGYIKNNSYFTLAWNRAINHYGTQFDNPSSNNLREYYNEKYGKDLKHYSGELNLGANFYIHPIGWLFEGFKAGICLDFIDLAADYYTFEDATHDANAPKPEKMDKYNDLKVQYSFNVGAIFTFSPAKNFYIDLNAKLCPTFAVNYFRVPCYENGVAADAKAVQLRNAGLSYGGYSLDGLPAGYDEKNIGTTNEEDTGIGLGLNYAFGFDLRYSKLLIGCEWNLGALKYSYDIWNEQKVYNQYMKIKIGMSFE